MKAKQERPYGMSEWHKVHDPQGKVSIAYAAFDLIEKYYDPQSIQDLINEKGVHGMISYINDTYRTTYGKDVLVLIENPDGGSSLYCSKEFPDLDNRVKFVYIDPSKLKR